MPARVIPNPGTDFKNSFDFKAVNPPESPKAPHRQLAKEIKVPSPKQTLY